MATHSSVLAWRIPGTGEPGGLPSMGSHRVGHDWSDLAAATTFKITLRSKGKQNENYKLHRNIEHVRRRAWGYTYSIISKQYSKTERLKIVELSFQLVLQTLRKLGHKYLMLKRKLIRLENKKNFSIKPKGGFGEPCCEWKSGNTGNEFKIVLKILYYLSSWKQTL